MKYIKECRMVDTNKCFRAFLSRLQLLYRYWTYCGKRGVESLPKSKVDVIQNAI